MPEALLKMYNTMPVSAQQELYDFALFLFSKNDGKPAQKKSCFGALKNKIKYIAPDFDAPLEDFAEYM